jgi:hypothetical protein
VTTGARSLIAPRWVSMYSRCGAPLPDSGQDRRRAVVYAVLSGSRNGDFEALLGLLDPDVVLSTDPAAEASGVPRELRGGHDVASMFSGRPLGAQRASIDGLADAIWAPGGPAWSSTSPSSTVGLRGFTCWPNPQEFGELDLELDDRYSIQRRPCRTIPSSAPNRPSDPRPTLGARVA